MKPHSGNKYLVLGIMSGTSLDGLDLAAVEFYRQASQWNYTIIATELVDYSGEWKEKLKNAHNLSGAQLTGLHSEYGRFIGREAKRFLNFHKLSPDLIASHGHTVFHQPRRGITLQIGNGAFIAAETGITTVADFRAGDVALGGQGAPLVPVGDRLLFSAYDYCLNLGGFANISFEQDQKRIAFDVCPVNFILNHLAEMMGKSFDENGNLGRAGVLNEALLERLNRLEFYMQMPPKSLGREWMDEYFLPELQASGISVTDKLRTVYEHIAFQIERSVPKPGKILVTGGGTFNLFLIERMKERVKGEISIPGTQLILFREALIFAFLGLLRFLEEFNCLASVTGARRNSSGGVIFSGESCLTNHDTNEHDEKNEQSS
jgi:anhydro-N-acetylmuramic acid kinase